MALLPSSRFPHLPTEQPIPKTSSIYFIVKFILFEALRCESIGFDQIFKLTANCFGPFMAFRKFPQGSPVGTRQWGCALGLAEPKSIYNYS
jgi:hypothetical protein